AARALRMLLDRGAKRSSLTALQYGEPLPEVGTYQPPGSANLPGAGMAVLRRGAGDDALCAMLEYGEHGGGHGHPDKLQLIFYGLGQTLCPDLGTTGYGVRLHGQWYKTTPAHNTVTLGMKSQAPTTGKLLAFDVKDQYAAASAESRGAYPGYRLFRKLLLTDRFLVDLFSVVAEEGQPEVTADWFLRAPGSLALSVPVAPLAEKAPTATYDYLKELRGAETASDWSAT
ncbi:MAG: heparinase II/III family protein, partial [Armatimonadota bacterium]|nr:heparinase II/III family protein [Armatimonadota bacterium]